ncbi:MAG TPA: ATP-binding protein [Vicinamibacterales bacterium]|nr:ATP-binding protein [Vicinamibacterales bacterium]
MSRTDLAKSDLLATAMQRWFEELSDRGIFTTDASLVVRTWNPWLEAQTGVPASAAIGASLTALYTSVKDRGLDRYYANALAGEVHVLSERFHKFLIPIPRNIQSIGLSEMAQSARIAPLTLDGTVVGTITVIEDVTERVVSERELRNQIAASERARKVAEEASKLKDEFLATMSHEIRTPLNAVLGWARILRTQPRLKARDHGLEVIERNAASQLRLVEDLLDMARVISGKLRLELKVIAFEDVVRAAIDVVTPAAAAKNITISTSFDKSRPAISGDFDRMQQAVWNLMSNAVKFTDAGGRVDAQIACEGATVELTVRDTGQGITRDFLPYLFDRFRQADASASRRHGGLGLGLALVRQIVELHGGSVEAASAGANRGSTFTVRLPLASGQFVAPSRPSEPVTLKGIHVLVVDDNEDGREMLMTALREYGAIVHAAANSAQALALLEEHLAPDLLISDIGMPETDGYEFMRRVRTSANAATRLLPAIAVTAYANPEDRIRATVAGYQAHFPKPVDAALLAASIASLVGPRHASKRRKG